MKKTIDIEFDLEEIVYLKTDSDQKARIVIGFWVQSNVIKYDVSCGVDSSWVWGFELSKEKDILMCTSN